LFVFLIKQKKKKKIDDAIPLDLDGPFEDFVKPDVDLPSDRLVPTVRLRMPQQQQRQQHVETTPVLQGPVRASVAANANVRVKLRVSADTKRHLVGNVLRFPLENEACEAVLTIFEGISLRENVSAVKLEQLGLSDSSAQRLSIVLERGLGDWVWNAHIAICNYAAMERLIPKDKELESSAVYTIATLGPEQRVHFSIRLGETELVNMTMGLPNETFVLPVNWCFPRVGVVVGNDPSIYAVCEVNEEDGVVRLQQGETGTEKFVARNLCAPAWSHKARERAVVVGGKYFGKLGRVVLTSDQLVQLQLEDDPRVRERERERERKKTLLFEFC
jgi:hypothetical protein